jgi:hypothetical protein
LKVAYCLDKTLAAAAAFRVRTSEPVTPARAKAFTRLMERAYLATHTLFKTRPPGGPSIVDESAGSVLMKAEEAMINLDPSEPVSRVQGHLQILPMDGVLQAARTTMVPPALGESQIEYLELPE